MSLDLRNKGGAAQSPLSLQSGEQLRFFAGREPRMHALPIACLAIKGRVATTPIIRMHLDRAGNIKTRVSSR